MVMTKIRGVAAYRSFKKNGLTPLAMDITRRCLILGLMILGLIL